MLGIILKNIIELQDPNFLNEVSIKFGISNPKEKYHVPLLVFPLELFDLSRKLMII